ncbi:pseudouridylate synthase 7 homolog [Acropora muricata]|uniref:pseudouridylate synthase 7 homolog n=1 Tax=Acropora muricata TaxID=159855 RepID=UPI0034E3D613
MNNYRCVQNSYSLNSSRNLCLGNFKYCKEPLKLGSLSGNHFVITLRSIVGGHSKIEESLKSLKVNGFINYFGLQRFGTTSVSTHAIGLALLQSKWSETIDPLNPRDGESDILTAARQHWKDTKNAKEALQKIPKGKFIESDLLQGLVRHGPSGLVNALQSIPRNTRLMYVHAYQSYVSNFMTTKRIKEYGLQPVKGDLIVKSASSVGCAENTDGSQAGGMVQFISEPSRSTVTVLTEDHIKSGDFTIQDVVLPLPGYNVNYPENNMKDHYRQIMADDDLDIDNMRRKVKDYALSGAYRRISHIAFLLLFSHFTDGSQAGGMVQFISEPSRSTVTVLTEDHIKSGDFTIQDVVLPLPGYNVNYPENNMKDHYRQIMADDDLDIDNMRRKVKDYALSGAYRKLLVKPSQMNWHWFRYNDIKEPLALTDMDRLKGAQEPQSVPDGKYWALQLGFTLPTSTYATMALREVLRCNTSSAYQASLNQD